MGLMNAPLFAAEYDPQVKELFQKGLTSVPDTAARFFKDPPCTRADKTIQVGQIMELGDWKQRDDGVPAQYDNLGPGYITSFTNLGYKEDIVITEEMMDVGGAMLLNEIWRAESIAASGQLSIQKLCAAVFANAASLSVLGGDGKPLAADDHPYPPTSPLYGSTQDNKATTAVSYAQLTVARNQLLGQLSLRGNKFIDSSQKIIILSSDGTIEDSIKTLIANPLKPGVADNDPNIHYNRFEHIPWYLIADANDWFLIHPTQHELRRYFRVRPEIRGPYIATDGSNTVTWHAQMFCSIGFADWRGVQCNIVT